MHLTSVQISLTKTNTTVFRQGKKYIYTDYNYVRVHILELLNLVQEPNLLEKLTLTTQTGLSPPCPSSLPLGSWSFIISSSAVRWLKLFPYGERISHSPYHFLTVVADLGNQIWVLALGSDLLRQQISGLYPLTSVKTSCGGDCTLSMVKTFCGGDCSGNELQLDADHCFPPTSTRSSVASDTPAIFFWLFSLYFVFVSCILRTSVSFVLVCLWLRILVSGKIKIKIIYNEE